MRLTDRRNDDGFEDDDGQGSYVEQLDDDEYIEDEQEMTLDEFYAQAHNHLIANGFNSKEDINAL